MAETDALWRHIEGERRDILDLLRSLSAEEWLAPSLCDGWRVRDVASHLLVDETLLELGMLPLLARLAWWRWDIHKANAWWIEHCREWPVDRLVDRSAAAVVPGRISKVLGPVSQLRATVVHHADMRVPLGKPTVVPPARVRALLDVLPTPAGSANLGSAERAAGLRLVATDLDWVRGEGPEVHGPGLALALALAGRAACLPDLAGEGLGELAARVASPAPAESPRRVLSVMRHLHDGQN